MNERKETIMVETAPELPPTSYSRVHAEIYDAIHTSRGRDWAYEADEIARTVRTITPDADSLLDVACGTGAHMERLSQHFSEVEGLEISPGMRRLAQERIPGMRVHSGDMRSFDLGRRYSAVICMCYSLGYMASLHELESAAVSIGRHLVPGGVAILEPWWFPERFLDGYVTGATVEETGRVISRTSHSVRDGEHSRMTVRYTVADGAGISEFTEYEVHSLFPRQVYADAFAKAGVHLSYREGGPNGRGLFVGTLD
ncbi:class I SAM-dependent methyltransferase [Lipingzhangella sp. LS1_29]|uniref:Class I SAM-dependent methyltransferase n=1 Tax=Lipingzhangella rawalii TaxID=2055835 RepID=A0ABU2H676_9ACTN|nr:class I SAM-dependent methyltransferase [Lipingzhangella rawalii]MDS1270790.1 class I SAM-dependent methyltransferase [Lipingzhangella rawalii]